MQNLLDLLKKYQFAFVFIFLQIIAMIMLVNRNTFHRFAYLNTTNAIVGNFLETQADIKGYFNLQEQNLRLQNENANLRSKLCDLEDKYFEIADSIPVLDLDSTQFTFIKSRIINVTQQDNNQFLTINKGSKSGIKPHMGVISTTGIVGKTLYVSDYFSIVMSILHEQSYFNVKVGKDHWDGSLHWNGRNDGICQINSISKTAIIEIGDSVFTNNYSTTFPENILVGTVAGVQLNLDNQFFEVDVKLSHDFNNLDAVYLLQDHKEDERLILEDSIQDVSR
ncbi:MAG: rod shape-determining protein MreC [Flavobacteriales bacterium]